MSFWSKLLKALRIGKEVARVATPIISAVKPEVGAQVAAGVAIADRAEEVVDAVKHDHPAKEADSK